MRLTHLFLCIFCLVLGTLLMGCGHSDTFRVKGSVEDGASINIRFIYIADGAVRSGLTASVDGKFEFEGSAASPAYVEVYDNDYRLLGRFIAVNGDDISLNLNRKNRYLTKVGGGNLNRELTEFYNANADSLLFGTVNTRNNLVSDYVAEHPASALSLILLSTDFDASRDKDALLCDSLISTFDPDVFEFDIVGTTSRLAERVANSSTREPVQALIYKVRGNRNETFVPSRQKYSVISISDASHSRDSVRRALKHLARHQKDGRFAILDLSADTDTTIWVRSIANDSATWKQGWAAGSISGIALNRLGIPSIPYFILIDSTGSQVWRGPSYSEVVSRAVEALTPEEDKNEDTKK